MVASANYFEGQDYAEAAPPVMNKLSDAASALFASPSTTVPGADFMPAAGSSLIDKADPATAPADDFDLAPRPVGAGPDVGAYESGSGSSKHWALALAFKGGVGAGGIPSSGGSGGAGGAVNGGNANGGGGTSAGGTASGGKKGAGDDSSGGCGCTLPGERRHGDLVGLAFWFALIAVRRRSRHSRAHSR